MRVILDTHAFLWFTSGDPRLSATVRSAIEDPANRPLLSIASLWEMAIKVSLGKLILRVPFETLVPEQVLANGMEVLDIDVAHVAAVVALPFHHRDPFDRLLVA